jgi:uncharacterized membrane protein
LVNSRRVATTAVFAAFVAAATMAFSLSIPVTNGYFNVGEVMVYTAALLMGPSVGGFAGGVGSMISDLSLGFPVYAPGTLVIKGVEGFLVGYLSSKALAGVSKRLWRAASIAVGAGLGLTVAVLGAYFLSGVYDVALGFPIGPVYNASFSVPYVAWVALGGVIFVLVAAAGYLVDERLGLTVLSVLVGGSEMVVGYFVYESLVLRLGFASASGEVPFNIAQALIGVVVGVPLALSIRRVMGRIGERQRTG